MSRPADPRIIADPTLRLIVADNFDLLGHRDLRDLNRFIEIVKQDPQIAPFVKMAGIAPQAIQIVATMINQIVASNHTATILRHNGALMVETAAHLRQEACSPEQDCLSTENLHNVAEGSGLPVQALLTPLTDVERLELKTLTALVLDAFGPLH